MSIARCLDLVFPMLHGCVPKTLVQSGGSDALLTSQILHHGNDYFRVMLT